MADEKTFVDMARRIGDEATGPGRWARTARRVLLSPQTTLAICALLVLGMAVLDHLRSRQQVEYGFSWALSLLVLALLGLGILQSNRSQKRASKTVDESAAQFERQLDLLPQLVWACDVNAQATYLNQPWADYSGKPVSALLGSAWLDLMHPDDYGRVVDQWNKAVVTGNRVIPPFRVRRHDGVYRWFKASFGVSVNDHGHPVSWFGSSIDIDDAHNAHEALAQREQFYGSTLSAMHEAVMTFDAKGRATGCNPATERILDIDSDAVLRTPPRDWGIQLHFEDGKPMPLTSTPLSTALRTGKPCRDVTLSVTLPSGQQHWLNTNIEPVHGGPNGEVTALVASFRDVTERKKEQIELQMHRDHLESLVDARTRELTTVLDSRTRAEQLMHSLNDQLQEAERFVRLVADSVPGRLVYWDRQMRCRFVNRAQCEWFNEQPHQVLGRTLREIRGDKITEAVMPHALAALSGEPQDFERVEYSQSGVRTETRIQYIPDRREGEVKGFVVLASNITRHKQAEQLLRLRNEQLVDARDRADAANLAKSTFLANMSHEIRTPMNAIIGFTHMLRRDIKEPTHQQRLAKIGNAANHLLQVINDILDLSRIEAGKLALEKLDFSLDALLSRTGSMVVEAAREKGLELVINVDPLPDRLHGDPTRLMQGMLNLLSNAVKFTEQGVVSLHVQTLDRTERDLLVRFDVTDTGVGISAEAFAQLFQPFAQADESSTRRHGGTGLGLAITRHIAEAMGGEAGGESQAGKGSRFWFTARLDMAVDETPRPAPVLRGLRALVADDLPEARDALADMLTGLGLRVDVVASGTQALDQAERATTAEDPYSVVLLDWNMPGLDGIQTGARLSDSLEPPQAMVLVSARDHASVHQLARDAGFGAVLLKPLTPSMLLDCLMRLLKNAARTVEQAERTSSFDTPLGAGHHGARVLLAEDNPVNQEVAVQLLESAGLHVDVAGDGEQAVHMARSQRYDLLLMDMQMPRMDGLQATRLLREDPAFRDLPIIAMTANAFQEDRQACLDAGMNDHLGKPVDPRVLYATLVRWLPAQREYLRPPEVSSAPAPLLPMTLEAPAAPAPAKAQQSLEQKLEGLAPLIDLPQAYEFAAGEARILARVLQQFVTHYRDAGGTLLDQIYMGEFDGPARTLHSLRGVSGMIGAVKLKAMTAQLERAVAQREKQESLLPKAVELRNELDALVAAVAERLGL